MNTQIMFVEIHRLQEKMPSGQKDPKAFLKLMKEYQEYLEEKSYPEKILEAADIFYYCTKSIYNGFLSPIATIDFMSQIAVELNLTIEDIFHICFAKYTFRSQVGNPKNPETEKEFAIEYLRSKGC